MCAIIQKIDLILCPPPSHPAYKSYTTIVRGFEGAHIRDKKKFWNALTENYFNSSLLTIHTEFVRVQDKFSLYWSSSIKQFDNEPFFQSV